jgi:hypothetical protein
MNVLSDVYRGFAPFIQVFGDMVLQIQPRLLPSTRSPIHYSSVILVFDVRMLCRLQSISKL